MPEPPPTGWRRSSPTRPWATRSPSPSATSTASSPPWPSCAMPSPTIAEPSTTWPARPSGWASAAGRRPTGGPRRPPPRPKRVSGGPTTTSPPTSSPPCARRWRRRSMPSSPTTPRSRPAWPSWSSRCFRRPTRPGARPTPTHATAAARLDEARIVEDRARAALVDAGEALGAAVALPGVLLAATGLDPQQLGGVDLPEAERRSEPHGSASPSRPRSRPWSTATTRCPTG